LTLITDRSDDMLRVACYYLEQLLAHTFRSTNDFITGAHRKQMSLADRSGVNG